MFFPFGRATYGNLEAIYKSSRIVYINQTGIKYNSKIMVLFTSSGIRITGML